MLAAWLHSEVAVPKAGVVGNATPTLWNSVTPPGEYQVAAGQDHSRLLLPSAPVFQGPRNPATEGMPGGWELASTCLSHKLSSLIRSRSHVQNLVCIAPLVRSPLESILANPPTDLL